MSDRRVVVFRYPAGSGSFDTERFRSQAPAAEAAPRLAPGASLLLALLLSFGLWGRIWELCAQSSANWSWQAGWLSPDQS
jgi:hypothetical protein